MPSPTSDGVTRRTALRTLGAGAGAAVLLPWLSDAGLLAFTELQRRNAPPAPRALAAARFATLETLVDALIPADDRSPGAREARVADYIDLLLSEANETLAADWSAGLDALDAEGVSRFGQPFAGLDAASIDAVMSDLARNESAPVRPVDHFFLMAKHATIRGYYTSEIGIHKELQYKGNRAIAEFVGCATVDGQDCPHCGQKAEG